MHAPQPKTSQPQPSSPWLFLALGLIILLACLFPTAGHQRLYGLAFCAGGLLMVAYPPKHRFSRLFPWLAAGYLAAGLLMFLPATWFGIPSWRSDLTNTGLALGTSVTPHGQISFDAWQLRAGLVAIAVYMLGHRLSERWHLRFAALFALFVALYTILAVANNTMRWQPIWDNAEGFGFFHNRNHTATLLVMGVITSIGVLFQAIRLKNNHFSALGALTLVVTSIGLFGFSISRAGLFLGVGLTILWFIGLGSRYASWKLWAGVVAIIIAASGIFLNSNTLLRERLKSNSVSADFRQQVYKATLGLIKEEPITGVGLGLFRTIFPFHRESATSAATCLHPESNWLMVWAEEGLLAVLLLAASIAVAWRRVFREAWKQHLWPLRWNGIVAAATVPIHAFIDVPGHHIGLALASVFLLCLTLRPRTEVHQVVNSRLAVGYRVLGAGVLLLGIKLVYAEWFGGPALAVVQVQRLQDQAVALEQADRQERAAQGNAAPAVLSSEEDKLEQAIDLLDKAIRIAPMEADLHYMKGVLALNFTDKQAIAKQAFAIQRKLLPHQVQLPIKQAAAWMLADPQETEMLWNEGLQRARKMNQLAPGKDWNEIHVIGQALLDCQKVEPLQRQILPYLLPFPKLLSSWAQQAPPTLLDELLPPLFDQGKVPAAEHDQILKVWMARGDKSKAKAYQPTLSQ